MVKKNFNNSDDLRVFLADRRIPRYALAFWPEAPEQGETLLFSNNLRPLCKYVLGIPDQPLRLACVDQHAPTPLWRAVNVPENMLVAGRTREEAEDHFWQEIEALLREGGFECALYERGRTGTPDLNSLLAEWQMTERIRNAGAMAV